MPLPITPPGADPVPPPGGIALERRGRRWLLWSFLLCPCHLPLSIGVLGAVLAGTSAGALLRDHAWLAGGLLTVTWLAGTAYGFHLIRQAERTNGACPVPTRRR
jgi:hypothetical protein